MVDQKRPHIESWVLLAYLDDELDGDERTAVERWLDTDVENQRTFARIKEMHIRLAQSIPGTFVVTPQMLTDYALGYLPQKERLLVKCAVESNSEYRRELDELQAFLALPDDEPAAERAAEDPAPYRLITARLVGALSQGTPRPVGALRGEVSKPILFEANDLLFSITLLGDPETELFTITGVVSGLPESFDMFCSLYRAANRIATVAVEPPGFFTVEGVEAGDYSLRFDDRRNQVSIQIPPFEI